MPRSMLAVALLIALVPAAARTQTSVTEPGREQLLNGLTVLFWNRPGDANAILKLRIRSGAAFDLADKGGVMALLGDALFPDPATAEYVSEQLGGKLEVSTDYDAINVTISGKASEFERMVDLLRAALITTQLTPEMVAKLRDARAKQLAGRQTLAIEADQAVSKRFFGSYPYGHPAGGTAQTVAKVERADLMLSRERFLNADNATLVVVGGVDKGRMMRTLRQLLGPWQKSGRVIPSTFRQPLPPDLRIQIVDQPTATKAEVRVAVRGLARSDRDANAALLLALIAKERWQSSIPGIASAFARHEAYALPGVFVMGGAVPNESTAKAILAAQQVLQALGQSGPSAEEVERARNVLMTDANQRLANADLLAETWLDIDTYKLPPANTLVSSIAGLTVADVQRVATRLLLNTAMAKVVVGRSDQLTPSFQGNVEDMRNKVEARTNADGNAPSKKP